MVKRIFPVLSVHCKEYSYYIWIVLDYMMCFSVNRSSYRSMAVSQARHFIHFIRGDWDISRLLSEKLLLAHTATVFVSITAHQHINSLSESISDNIPKTLHCSSRWRKRKTLSAVMNEMNCRRNEEVYGNNLPKAFLAHLSLLVIVRSPHLGLCEAPLSCELPYSTRLLHPYACPVQGNKV